jgi:uncharacterized protein (TIGR02996 family)
LDIEGVHVTEDRAFIQAIQASPNDEALRLVYADWLEERSDPRGEYLRLEASVASTPTKTRKAKALRVRFQELRSQIKPSWLAVFDQPGLMRANPTPFPSGWWSVDLEGYREGAETYGLFPYESLPPLPVELFRANFHWLTRLRKQPSSKRKVNKKLEHLGGAAATLNLRLPRDFKVFMASSSLQRRVRSCTGCSFNWPKKIVESPLGEGGYLARFYSDSQDCLHWYLYLTQGGYHCVVTSGGFYGGHEWDKADEDWDEPSDEFWFCAPSFEAFIYRYWMEDEIWWALSNDHDPLTADEQAYVNHYVRP